MLTVGNKPEEKRKKKLSKNYVWLNSPFILSEIEDIDTEKEIHIILNKLFFFIGEDMSILSAMIVQSL